MQVIGEIANLRPPARTRVYFELRDGDGALPCAMWRNDWERLGAVAQTLADGAQVIVEGGCDYYPGSASASPAFSFNVKSIRVAGEGDLLAQIERRRQALAADGLLDRQRALTRVLLPRTIGIVCAKGGKARRRPARGARAARLGGAHRLGVRPRAGPQRRAADRAALHELAASGEVEVIVVTRGGGSPTDLLAFSDEMLCRTVALLAVPVIASIGHHTDHTLLDDVAAESCSTPTHAAEAAVPLQLRRGPRRDARLARRGCGATRARASSHRARLLAAMSRAPAVHIARHRRTLHQTLRELRASSRRRRRGGARPERPPRPLARAAARGRAARLHASAAPPSSSGSRLALAAHDPQRTLARGYALVEDPASGHPVSSAAAARAAGRVRLRFADDAVAARIEDE